MSKTLYLIRGVPGSGKTTLARAMSEDLKCPHWEADMWMTGDGGQYAYDPSRVADCHNFCQRAVNRDMIVGFHAIIVSNTFIRKWEADVYYALAKLWGYQVKVICCEGNFENVHGVSKDRVNIMRANMEPYSGQTFHNP